jgi:elongation factor Ts
MVGGVVYASSEVHMSVGKAVALTNPQGHVGSYVYAITNKIAVLMSFSGNKPDAELMKDLGGHIAFTRPAGLSRNDIPAELIAKEKEIAVEQAKATGKPQEIAEKIAEGKMGAFYKDRALLDQDFFNAQKFKGSIQQMLKEKGITLQKYVRLEVGQS